MSSPVDHPGPCQWPGCTRPASYFFGENPWRLCPEHREQEKKDAAAARVSEIERIKREAPGLWRWKEPIELEDDEVAVLVDRQGNVICDFGMATQYYPSEGAPPDAPERALIAAAPEMADLLREQVGQCKGIDFRKAGPNGLPLVLDSCGKCWDCRTRALLARIDEARRG